MQSMLEADPDLEHLRGHSVLGAQERIFVRRGEKNRIFEILLIIIHYLHNH